MQTAALKSPSPGEIIRKVLAREEPGVGLQAWPRSGRRRAPNRVAHRHQCWLPLRAVATPRLFSAPASSGRKLRTPFEAGFRQVSPYKIDIPGDRSMPVSAAALSRRWRGPQYADSDREDIMVRLGGAASPTYVSIFRGLQAHFLHHGIELDWVIYSDYDALVEAFARREIDLIERYHRQAGLPD
jgi:hypothetical protein